MTTADPTRATPNQIKSCDFIASPSCSVLRRRLDPQHRAERFICQRVHQAIRAHAHVTDALVQLHEHRFAAGGQRLRVDDDALDVLARSVAHRADERMALPCGEFVAVVERQTRYRDSRYPEHDGLLEPRGRAPLADDGAVVIASERHSRPSVVLPRLNTIQLVAALRPLLGGPELARARMECKAERIAMTERVDLGLEPGAADERIVGRHGPVIANAQNLADVRARILGL